MADRSLIPKYVNYKPLEPFVWSDEPMIKLAIVLLFFAILCTFYFNNLVLVGVILYLIAIALPIYPIFSYLAVKDAHQPRPNIEDIDAIFFDDLESVVKPAAIRKLEIEADELEEAKILLIPGPVYWKDSNGDRFMGDDGIFRYSTWEIMVLALTDKYISIYECTYNWWYGGSPSDERVSEFFYNDIIAVKTARVEKERELKDDSKISSVDVFRLMTLSGDSLDLETNRNTLNGYPQIGEYTDVAIQEVRKILREKKYKEIDMEVVRNIEPTEGGGEADGDSSVASDPKLPPRRKDEEDDIEDFTGEI